MSNTLNSTNWELFFNTFKNPLKKLKTKDYRLTVRCKNILSNLEKSPEDSFPAVYKDKHQTKLLYRFLNNQKATEKDIQAATFDDTLAKIKLISNDSLIIVAQDTTEFNFTSKPKSQLGYLHKEDHNGFLSHSGLAITDDGLPIGLIYQDNWIRDRADYGKKKDRAKKPIQEKESYRWLDCLKKVESLAKKEGLDPARFLITGDRESDILEVLTCETQANLLIRCSHNRIIEKISKVGKLDQKDLTKNLETNSKESLKLEEKQKEKKELQKPTQKLFDHLNNQPIQAKIRIEIPHSGHSEISGQEVDLALKWVKIKLAKPKISNSKSNNFETQNQSQNQNQSFENINENHNKNLKSKNCKDKDFYLIQAKAIDPKIKICWTLITTLEVKSEIQAKNIVYYYHLRWLVERFHYVLKSGCKMEELQLKQKEALFKALALYNIVASQILLLTYLARILPEMSCKWLFKTIEWQSIYIYILKKKPKPNQKPPNLKEIVELLARIGGYIPNKRYPPGVKALWKGLKVMGDIVMFQGVLGDVGKG